MWQAASARAWGVNDIGLQRRGFKPETIAAAEVAIRTPVLLKDAARRTIAKTLEEYASSPRYGGWSIS